MHPLKLSIKALWIVPGLLLAATGVAITGGNNGGTEQARTQKNNGGFAQVTEPSIEVSDPHELVRAFVRAVHMVPGAGPVTVNVNGKAIATNLAFGDASEFVGLQGDKVKIHATRDHQITVTNADNKALGTPLPVDMERGEDVTIVIGGAPGKVTLTPFEHTSRGPEADQAKVAVLHADRTLGDVAISVDGKNWPGDIDLHPKVIPLNCRVSPLDFVARLLAADCPKHCAA